MKTFLRLTKGQATNNEGLVLLRLALWVDGKEHDHFTAISGAPGRQTFRKGKDSQAGSMEPIPEGEYVLGGVCWAGRAGDFSTIWNDGLGPFVVDVNNKVAGQTGRGELRIHSDWNEAYAPGTAGCIGIQGESGPRDLDRLRCFLDWMAKHKPAKLFVDWGLGTCPKPLSGTV